MEEWISTVLILVVIWLGLMLFAMVGRKLAGSTVDKHRLTVRHNARGHHWLTVDAFDAGSYCCVCETSTFSGARCDFCDILVDSACLRKADSKLMCKQLTQCSQVNTHHWVHGNLLGGSVCGVCDELCGDGPGLQDYRCCWCQLNVHTNCMPSLANLCDFGKLKRVIVPPNCIKGTSSGWKGRKIFTVTEVLRPNVPDWSPVIIIANRQSGNGEGAHILESFRRVVNPAQVIDLAEHDPLVAIEWCRLISEVQCRILVAGGDGTVTWVLSTIDTLNLTLPPTVAILPLGTGNDLSRCMGYGSGHSGPIDPIKLLLSLDQTKCVLLDRWKIDICPLNSGRRFAVGGRKDKQRYMTNYFSIGVDALVTFNFHQRRTTIPRVISSRILNKFLFFTYGTKDVYERACSGLQDKISVKLDGKAVELPSIEGLVFLNIPTWGAGVRPMELGNNPPQKIDDMKFEVFALYSSFHIAQLQVGLSEPHFIGQAHCIELQLLHGCGKVPMQIDGEPWLQGACRINMAHQSQMPMLAQAPFDSVFSSPQSSPNSSSISFF